MFKYECFKINFYAEEDMRLLIAEDDPKLLKTLIHIFKMNNYVVDGVSNGRDALNFALSGEYDGIILDIMMPFLDGIEVLKKLRESSIQTPVLFLTAKDSVEQQVEGLDAGADDYISKPFHTAELLARVRAMLRRKENYLPDVLSVGSTSLDRMTFEVFVGEKREALSAKEFQILEMLMQQPKVIVPAERLITHIWGWDSSADTSAVWAHLSNIRKKLSSVGSTLKIHFVRSAGYVLEDGE